VKDQAVRVEDAWPAGEGGPDDGSSQGEAEIVEMNHVVAGDLTPDYVRPVGERNLGGAPTGDSHDLQAVKRLPPGQAPCWPGDVTVEGQDRNLATGRRLRGRQIVDVLLCAPDERPIPAANVQDADR
jgi:hypothetical protein